MIEYVNFQNDVRFIADDEDGDCMDIDVKPGVEKVIFGDYYDFFLKLSKKVFPDVKELHISEYAGVISISNEMFPNVRKVTSEKNFYREGSMLCGGLHGDFSLYNTFCLKPDETADLSGISAILDFAFSGSETLNVTGSDGINTYNREAFNNSAIGRLPFVNGVKCINGMVFDVDTECDNVVFPDEDEDLHTIANHLPFEKIKQITVHRGSTVQLLYRCNTLPKAINICGNLGESVCQTKEEMASRLTIDSIAELCDREGVENINIFDDSKTYKSIDSIVYSYDGKRLLKCPRGKTGHVSIPEGTKTIGVEAFRECMISSVSLPDSLTEIKGNAFSCSLIQKIDFGHGITSLGDYEAHVFSHCNDLIHVEIPSNIETIGNGAFFSCKNLESVKIHEGVKWIRDSAFAECDNLRSVELPSSVEYIGDSSFISTETLKVDSAFGGLLYAFTGSYAADFDVKKLIIKDKTYYLPLVFNPKQLYILNMCNKAAEFPNRPFYKDAICTELKQNTALYLYENHIDNSDEVKKYLKRSSKQIAYRLLDANKDDKLVKFLRLGLLSKASLNELLLSSREKDNASISSYILEELDKFSQSTFRL